MKTSVNNILRNVLAAITAAAFLIVPSLTHAGKPGGSGGGGSGPAGTIYYYEWLDGETSQSFSMKPDGSQKTGLGVGAATPGLITHGGKRWFLQSRGVPGLLPNGWVRWENFAVREDGAVAVQLTDDPAMQVQLDWTPSESAGTAVLAGVGRRWNADGTDDVASIGVYSTTLRFDADGNATGLEAAPAFLVSIGTAVDDMDGTLRPDIWTRPSFSPDMTKFVADRYGVNQGLRIVEVATGAATELVPGTAEYPEWSPNGAKIAFRVVGVYGDNIDVVSPNGTGRSTVFKGRAERTGLPSGMVT